MLDNLSNKLKFALKRISGSAYLTEKNIEEAVREVRIALLEADVSLDIVKEIIEQIRTDALGRKVLLDLKPDQAFIGVVRDAISSTLGSEVAPLNLNASPPLVIMMVGLQGAGKTTTSAKLAHYLKQQKKKVLLVSLDFYRPAAIKQLQVLAQENDLDFFNTLGREETLEAAQAAVNFAKVNSFDILLVDTAGRNTLDEFMMTEIRKLENLLNPQEVLYTVDSMQGQVAVANAKAFASEVPITGLILTKMDGDSRGGAALSLVKTLGKPIKFLGISEKIPSGLEVLHPDRLAGRILGMGDILSLVDELQSKILPKKEEAQVLLRKKGFSLEDFRNQLLQLNKMGGLDSVVEKLPSKLLEKLPEGKLMLGESTLKRQLAIINSMTLQERTKPEILKASRKRRVAQGSGVSVQHVNQLLNQFEQLSSTMKKLKGGGMAKMLKFLR